MRIANAAGDSYSAGVSQGPQPSAIQQVAQRRSPPLPASLTLWLRWEHAFLLVAGIWFWGAFFVHQSSVVGFGFRTDFLGIYVGARAVATGHGYQLYNTQFQKTLSDIAITPYHRGRVMAFIYPAYVAVLFRPLGTLSFGRALETWGLINVVAAVWTAIRLSIVFASTSRTRLALIVIFFCWIPLQLTLIQGQLGIFPTLAILEAITALRSGRDWRAGGWLSVGLLKPQLVLFPLVVLGIWRCWRSLLAFAIAAAGLLVISIGTLGNWIPTYASFLVEYNRRGAELSLDPRAMQNWRGLACWLFQTTDGPAVRWSVLVLGLVSIVVVSVLCSKRGYGDQGLAPASREGLYAVAVVLGVLSSPHLYIHDWVAAFPAGLILWLIACEQLGEGGVKSQHSTTLLWLLALSPVCFFVAEFIWVRPLTPIYMALLVAVAVLVLGQTQNSGDRGKAIPART